MKAIRKKVENYCDYKEVLVEQVNSEIKKIVPRAEYYREEDGKYFLYEKWNTFYDSIDGLLAEAKYKIGDEYFEETFMIIPQKIEG